MGHGQHPGILNTYTDGCNTIVNEGLAYVNQFFKGGGCLQIVLIKHLSVVEQSRYGSGICSTIELTIVGSIDKRCSGKLSLIFLGVIFVYSEDLTGLNKGLGEAAAPGKEQIRELVGCNRRLNLCLVGFILKGFMNDFYTGVCLFKICNGLVVGIVECIALSGNTPENQLNVLSGRRCRRIAGAGST